jgi:NADH-quinone oxidoreductase subunit J
VSTAVLFYLYAAIAIAGAVVLVAARNLVHGVVGLFATLVAIGGLYLLIGSEFLAAMQLFVYGGAITVLVLFGLMLVGPALDTREHPRRAVVWLAAVVSVLFFVAIALVLWQTNWHVTAPHIHDTASIATILFSRYVLPFEIAGLSLTIALIGAIVIAREDDVTGEPISSDAALAEDQGGAG